MKNKVLIEIGIASLPYNLYNIIIRNLRESIIKKLDSHEMEYNNIKFTYSKNRIIFSIELFNNNKISINKELVEDNWVDIINNTLIPVKELELSNSLTDYIIWVQGMLNEEYLEFSNFNISNIKLKKVPFYKMENIDTYKETLNKNNIIFESEERRSFLINKANKLTKEYGGILFDSDYLVEEYINDYNLPFPLIREFDNKLLEYPNELVTAILVDICKVFPVLNKKNSLMPYFVFCIEKEKLNDEPFIKEILDEKIDTILYILNLYEEDIKYDYDYYLDKMKEIKNYYEIGSLYDKTLRIKEFAVILGNYLDVGDNTIENIKIEADICKVDLTTNLVMEMPELKGVVGCLYAKEKGFNDIIASSIKTYYRPRFFHDKMPETTSAKILGIADKLDTIANSFIYNQLNNRSNKFQTTEIRRLASGIINIIIDNKWDLNLSTVVNDLIYMYIKYNNIVLDYEILKKDIESFIITKFREDLLSRNFSYYDIDELIKENPHYISKLYELLDKGVKNE